jgi:molecular chaperone DnaJ
MSKDYYEILGVTKSAGKEDIKKAFHKKAHLYHPDKKDGDAVKFKEVNEAYQTLSDDQKRSQYDQFGTAYDQPGGQGAGGFGGFGGFRNAQGATAGFDMGEIFSEFFSGARGQAQGAYSQGQDIQIDMSLTLVEAVAGVTKEVVLYRDRTCVTCDGVGGDKNSGSKKCATCNGHGKVTKSQQTILGNIQVQALCDTCQGGGMVFEKECATCKGKGVKKEETKLSVNFPAGIATGQMIRMTGEGEAIKQGQSGDLLITVHVQEDARFRREGPHLYTSVPVPFSIAALGGTVDVETIDNKKLSLKIPAGTQSGKVFRIAGAGAGVVNSSRRGDLLVTAQLFTPQKLSRKQKKMFKDLENEGL